jgi:hypothetical protein
MINKDQDTEKQQIQEQHESNKTKNADWDSGKSGKDQGKKGGKQ